MMFELRIDIFDSSNIIRSLYCEPATLFTLQAQATTPSIYLHIHIVLAFTEGFQTFSQGPTYIPVIISFEISKQTPFERLRFRLCNLCMV